MTFTHRSHNCYSCPSCPVLVSVFPWNSVPQEWSPDFPKPTRGPERLATTTQPPASADTKPLRSGTRAAPIRIHGVLSSETFSPPPRVAQSKIPLPHPDRGVQDKAEGRHRPNQGRPTSGLSPGASVAHRRNHVMTVGVPLTGRGLGKP